MNFRLFRERRGSALLIVLGMLAFMIASAIAFSAYMRYSRLPSSYLRRTSASREMAKAAVARAIDDLDRAIGNNPYPGLFASDNESASRSVDAIERNYFYHRVFIGTNCLVQAFSDTVPVLTVEALGYIPPALVNEARYYGRLSPTAKWRSFDFDAGRYAYVALDVSDYFDVNRLRASAPRNSSPSGRVSIGYLMEASRTSPGSAPQQWDDSFMAKVRDFDKDTLSVSWGSKTPFVSLCDFNLALGASGFGNISSPFVDYIKNGRSDAFDAPGTTGIAKMNAMSFVTDGYFPESESTTASSSSSSSTSTIDEYDLNDPEYQPFSPADLEQKNVSLRTVWDYDRTKSDDRFSKKICTLGFCELWDYLDPDSVPLSLAIPTTERVPMVCGFRTILQDCKIKIEKSESDTEEPELVNESSAWNHELIVKYTIDKNSSFSQGFKNGDVKALVVYPFCRDDGTEEKSYSLDGRLSAFFSSEEMSLRTGNNNDSVGYSATKDMTTPGLNSDTGVITIPFATSKSVAIKAADISEEADAIEEVDSKFESSAASSVATQTRNAPLLAVTWKWTQKAVWDGDLDKFVWDPQMTFEKIKANPAEYLTEARCGMPAHKADGSVDTAFTTGLLSTLQQGTDKGPVIRQLNYTVSLAVKDPDDKYVDLVPASLKDDDLNGVNNYSTLGKKVVSITGNPGPMLRMDAGGFSEITLSIDSLEELAKQETEITAEPTPSTILCGDPRYNHAPENWFSVESTTLDKNTWLDNCGAHENGKDGDIFMSVSNQGYLQSIYELAFIPRLTDFTSHGQDMMSGNLPTVNDGRKTICDSFGGTVHSGYMWRTYDPLDVDGDAFMDSGFTSAGTGYKVNPYSDSTNILMAAFANTPLDWTCASTNVTQNGEDYASMTYSAFNSKYAWNEYSSGGKIKYETLEKIAGNFMDKISSNRKTANETELKDGSTLPLTKIDPDNWEDAWDELDWVGDDDTFAGVSISDGDPLWSVDRKFLYGYWRDCFAAKQQLFLVFIRAEPMMMGGGGMSSIPPQLGARAVALVWRDPTMTTAEATGAQTQKGYPHRTRILFYKPLE